MAIDSKQALPTVFRGQCLRQCQLKPININLKPYLSILASFRQCFIDMYVRGCTFGTWWNSCVMVTLDWEGVQGCNLLGW